MSRPNASSRAFLFADQASLVAVQVESYISTYNSIQIDVTLTDGYHSINLNGTSDEVIEALRKMLAEAERAAASVTAQAIEAVANNDFEED